VVSGGIMLDMIEEIDAALERAGLGGVTIVLVGPLADASLSYANICGEWCVLVGLFSVLRSVQAVVSEA